ncbi:MAG: hypothetical protein C4560_02640 [Nitrospiraceae bacterium]|nr:MAG: hypothetical protein C4560_02640 [Nitrospiraceae bacterium]
MKLFIFYKSGKRETCHCANSVLRNNRGIALVMVLILSLIALAMMSGLIYMVTSGTQVSGIGKRYSTTLEAGKGSIDIAYQVFSTKGDSEKTAQLTFFSLTASTACLIDKLNNATDDWDAACDSSLTITPGTASTYDMFFDLGTSPDPVYAVYAKIVDTVVGNSGADEGLIKTGVVASNPGEVAVMHIPYLYTVEIDAENAGNPSLERARLSALCQY